MENPAIYGWQISMGGMQQLGDPTQFKCRVPYCLLGSRESVLVSAISKKRSLEDTFRREWMRPSNSNGSRNVIGCDKGFAAAQNSASAAEEPGTNRLLFLHQMNIIFF